MSKKFRNILIVFFIFSFDFFICSGEEVQQNMESVQTSEIIVNDEPDSFQKDLEIDATNEDLNSEEDDIAKGGIAEIPEKKRPKKMDKEKADAAREKDESKDDEENNRKIIKYGLPSEIGELLTKLIDSDDPRFSDEIYDLFQTTTNASIKDKVLKYFTKLEDPCLEDFAIEVLNDPYDEKKEVVHSVFQYLQKTKTIEAVPPVITLLETENEDYFNDALALIGEIGGNKEAKFIAEYLNRDDLSDAQRQTLMRTLGKMKALNTWSKVVEILEDEDENTFVRMYAAEALGFMEKKEAVPILVKNYGSSDPNLRQYAIKGLSHYIDVLEAKSTIIQAVRDEHWKVRQEAINICKENKFTDAIPFLMQRAEKDSEKIIKNGSIEAIAAINSKEGNDYLVEKITDKKTGDSVKQKVVEVLLKEDTVGQKEILELAETCVDDDKRKNLRYAIGKELAKNSKPAFADICAKYLASKDTTTIGLGLDMYKNYHFKSVENQMRDIYSDKKANASIKNRIKKLLDITDEENTSDEKSSS